MAGGLETTNHVRADPFTLWRERQRDAPAPAPQPAVVDVVLSARRQAIVKAAWCQWRLARLQGEPLTGPAWDLFYTVLEQQTALQQVEDGGPAPRDLEACRAILNEAAAIIEELAAV